MFLLAWAWCGCSRREADDHDPLPPPEEEPPVQVRFATYNVAMYRGAEGDLAGDLADPELEQARTAAAVLQEVRPDIVLLNEFDHEPDGLAAQRFLENFLQVSQDGREPLSYPYVWSPPVNTGEPSGFDLNNDGEIEGGDDCFGYGDYPGQYGLLILSVYPIETSAIRTFQHFLWKDMPDAALPEGWYSEDELEVFRLSSKTHADIPIDLGGSTVHLLASHPTPPSFDGAEDRNGRRNRDEIRFWLEYIGGGPGSWHIDDEGGAGALTDESFVIVGDLNNDPNDGGADGSIVAELLAHPRAGSEPAPQSVGGAEQALLQSGRNDDHAGDPALDTADFEDNNVGNLRVDYVLPSRDLTVLETGVFWPASDDPLFELVGTYPFPVSDHRLVWALLEVSVP
jgi:endonuclease/exonuclease/phosphatase family metal-dependent hydrolase